MLLNSMYTSLEKSTTFSGYYYKRNAMLYV